MGYISGDPLYLRIYSWNWAGTKHTKAICSTDYLTTVRNLVCGDDPCAVSIRFTNVESFLSFWSS
jgi:hypothetical protein